MRKGEMIGLAILLSVTLVTILIYSNLPDKMIIGWDSKGQAIGNTTPKVNFIKTFLCGLIAIFILFLALSRIGKMRPETEETRLYYSVALCLSLFVFSLICFSVIMWNFGFKHNVSQVVAFCLGIILFYIGRVLGCAKPNWFISLPIPGSKRDKHVFVKANSILGKLFCIIGALGIISSFVTFYAFFAIHLAVLSTLFVFFYSVMVIRSNKG